MAPPIVLTPVMIRDIQEIVKLNADVLAARQQLQQHTKAIEEITQLVKTLNTNRNRKLQKVVGGNLIVEIDNKISRKELMDRKEQVQVSIKGIEEQIKHREDNLQEAKSKIYRNLAGFIPKDMRFIPKDMR